MYTTILGKKKNQDLGDYGNLRDDSEKNSPSMRFLIVDDDEDDYKILNEILLEKYPEETIQVDYANSYETAIKAIAENEYDIYLLDFDLGAKNTFDIINEQELESPAIIISGNTSQKIIKEALEDYQMEGFLRKEKLWENPTMLYRLIDKIKESAQA